MFVVNLVVVVDLVLGVAVAVVGASSYWYWPWYYRKIVWARYTNTHVRVSRLANRDNKKSDASRRGELDPAPLLVGEEII